MADKSANATYQLVETWVKGWALARELAPPVEDYNGFRVDVGWPEQVKRYVFPEINSGFLHLATTIRDPFIFLKVCASPEAVKKALPSCWSIQPPGFMMTCNKPMLKTKPHLPQGYALSLEKSDTVSIARIFTKNSEPAATGRMVNVNGYAIYDRIETQAGHRRKGLASSILFALQSLAATQDVSKGVLVATAEGKKLYETLGWNVHSLYTTAVIPDSAE